MNAVSATSIWEFLVPEHCQPEFEKIYGPNGAWAQLFSQSPDYFGTELIRDLNRSGRYPTLDRWTSRDALHRFKQSRQTAYDALDKQCESLTGKEMFVGDFEAVLPASR